MTRRAGLTGALLLALLPLIPAQDDYIRIDCQVVPRVISQGQEGTIVIRIATRSDIRISSYPEFTIRFDENSNVSFAKSFFLGSELNFPTTREKDNIFLDLQKEVAIPFRVNENALVGARLVSGEIVYTVFFPDSWHIKTFQKFSASFSVRRLPRAKRR